jgi:glucose/arabinose dehydrogenase
MGHNNRSPIGAEALAMLLRCFILLALMAGTLALAACAETAEALLAEQAKKAAVIAATQAVIATTEAAAEIQAAATQASTQPILSNLPKPGKGLLVINTPTMVIIQKDGHRYIVVKHPLPDDSDDSH